MPQINGYDLPDDLYYTEDHAWFRVEQAGRVRVGWTDFAQKLAGELSFVKVPRAGRAVKRGKVLFAVQSGKWAGKIKSPLEGTVVEGNEALVYAPETINKDCYGAGWVAVIEPANLQQDLQNLIPPGEKAIEWLNREIELHAPDRQ